MLAILDCLPTFYYVTFIAPLTTFFDMLMTCYSHAIFEMSHSTMSSSYHGVIVANK